MSPYGVPMPAGVPSPQGVPMAGPYGGGAPASPAPAPGMAPMPAAPPPAAYQGPSTFPPNLRPPTVGQNGFGLHPEVSHEELADYLLPKFKSVESSGNYQAKHPDPGMTASGAYGYTNGTWNNYKGFPRAMDAPPEIQDQRMKQDILGSLNRFGGDPFKVVANHYYPAYAHDPTKWDQKLPVKGAQTVKQYLESVLPAERVGKYLSAANGGDNAAAL